jgi:hypothetical protein
MKKFATIILNRNLPKITDKLYNKIKKNNDTDIYVVEAGSRKNNFSKYATWNANWLEAKKNGLRFPRGMNYALSNLFKENRLNNYDFFFLLANDAEIKTVNCIKKFERIFSQHPRLGILTGCASHWGESQLLKKKKTMYFWYMENHAVVLRKEFILDIMNINDPGYLNFLYDGKNFRGYGTESELIAKAYSNFWGAAITSEVKINENQSHLINKSNLIETDSYDKNLKLYIKEGEKWMKEKYGFKSKWSMQMYVKTFYDKFFEYYPNYIEFKL